MLAVSGLDVALVSAFAALGAAVAAPLSAWAVAVTNNRHDRWVKTYGDLRDAYTALLRHMYSRIANTEALVRTFEANDPEVFSTQSLVTEDAAAAVERLALVGSLASAPVAEAAQRWDTAWRAVFSVVVTAKHATEEERKQSVAEIRAALATLEDPLRQVREAIRTDIRHKS